MQDHELKAEFAKRIFAKFDNDEKSRLYNGAAIRREIRDAIDRGEEPVGYRVEWLKKSSQKVIHTLHEVAKEFNKEYPHDKASVQDLCDILNTTLKRLKDHA